MTLTECRNLMRLYQRMAEDVQFNWRTTARWALRARWAQRENEELRDALAAARDELASMTVRMQIAEDGRQIETRRAERALDTLARYEQQQWMARAIGAEAAEERMLAERHPRQIEGTLLAKEVIRSAPGLPADYMMVRKDYLTELHRDKAQAMAVYRRLCEKYASAMRELHHFQQDRQQGVVRLRRIEGTLPADDLRRAFAEGAAWWEFHSQGFTMFNSDRREAEAEAEARFPNGKPGPFEVQG